MCARELFCFVLFLFHIRILEKFALQRADLTFSCKRKIFKKEKDNFYAPLSLSITSTPALFLCCHTRSCSALQQSEVTAPSLSEPATGRTD